MLTKYFELFGIDFTDKPNQKRIWVSFLAQFDKYAIFKKVCYFLIAGRGNFSGIFLGGITFSNSATATRPAGGVQPAGTAKK